MKTIGFIGIGVMGSRMCARILNAGYRTNVFDVSTDAVKAMEEKGAVGYESPALVGKHSDVIVTMLPNSRIVESVMFGENGLISGLSAGKIYIDMSSSQSSSNQKISEKLSEIGVPMLDAPVSGGFQGAEKGTLSIMVGGPKEVFEDSLPLLSTMGKNIRYVGRIGCGDIIKSVNQVLFAMNMVAAAEAAILGVKAGIDPEVLLEIVNSGAGQSYATSQKLVNFALKRNFKPGFTLDLMVKDADIALNMARELHVPMAMGNLARETLVQAQNKGMGRDDCSGVIRLLEESTKTVFGQETD